MRKLLFLGLLILAGLIIFGCVEQKNYPLSKAEMMSSSNDNDINQDGIADYTIIDYNPIANTAAKFSLTRQVIVTTISSSNFTSYKRNITDADIHRLDQEIDDFVRTKDAAISTCNANLGLISQCGDIKTCSAFCSSNSQQCKRLSADYDNVLSSSILSYVQQNKKITDLIIQVKTLEPRLRSGTDAERTEVLEKLTEIKDAISEIEANPIYVNSAIKLCSERDFGLDKIDNAINYIGTEETQKVQYKYRVLELVKPSQSSGQSGVVINDRLPKNGGLRADQVQTTPDVVATDGTNTINLKWSPSKPSKEGYLSQYIFSSENDPTIMLAGLSAPDLTVSKVDTTFFGPTLTILNGIYAMTSN